MYALGTLCEDDEVKARIVELGAIASVVHQAAQGDIEVCARLCGACVHAHARMVYGQSRLS